MIRVDTDARIATVTGLVWEFFDFLRARYPEMQAEIDAYVAAQNVKDGLADFRASFMPPAGAAFLAQVDGAAAGTVMLKPHGPGEAEMNRMFVRPAARGHGLGRLLGQAAIAEARTLGYRRLCLSALYRHVEALPLYESLGFVRQRSTGEPDAGDARVIRMAMAL